MAEMVGGKYFRHRVYIYMKSNKRFMTEVFDYICYGTRRVTTVIALLSFKQLATHSTVAVV